MANKRPRRIGSVVPRGENRWELRVWDKYAKKTQARTVTAGSRQEAEDQLPQFVADMIGRRLSNAPASLTVAELANDWLGKQHVGHQTLQTYSYNVKVIARSPLGSLATRTLEVEDIERFVAELSRQMAPDTVRTIMVNLRSALRLGRRRNVLNANLWFEDMRTPRSRSRHTQAPHDQLIQRFLEALSADHHRDMALLLAFSGIRRQELCGLQVGDIDLRHPGGPAADDHTGRATRRREAVALLREDDRR